MGDVVVFDFDYTLADSSAGIIECIHHAMHHLDLPAVSDGRIRESIGLTLDSTLTFLTGVTDKTIADEFTRLFIEHADAVMVEKTVIYDIVPHVLESLTAADYRLGIVSTKYRYRIESILQRENLASHFKIIVGGEDVTEHKPHPSSLRRALQHLHCEPQDALYIGDHPVDAEAAHRAGVPFIAVLTGTSERSQFLSYHHLHILDNLSNLPGLMDL